MQNPTSDVAVEARCRGLPSWTGSWTGAAQNPSAVSAIRAVARGIGAARGHAAGEQAPRNLQLNATAVSAIGESAGLFRTSLCTGLAAEAGHLVAELCAIGMWERQDCGYRMLDSQALQVVGCVGPYLW
jgi:hypothetical protein